MVRIKIYDVKGKYWKTTSLPTMASVRSTRKRFPKAKFVVVKRRK